MRQKQYTEAFPIFIIISKTRASALRLLRQHISVRYVGLRCNVCLLGRLDIFFLSFVCSSRAYVKPALGNLDIGNYFFLVAEMYLRC